MYQPDPYDPDIHYDRPIEYPGATSAVGEPVEGSSEEERSRFAEMKESIAEKAASAKDQIAGKMSDLSHQARDKMQALQGRASEFGSRVQDRTRAAYIKTRDQVVQTADQHPLEVGLGCLAIGFVAGLAIPTPAPVNRYVGPTVDRLRARTREAGREMLQKGKRVAEAASNAARDEAQSQGITVDRLRSSASAIKDRAQSAATEAARDESAGGATPPM